jgi:uncharacterized protein YhbP (UPF0306 family)
MILGTADPNTAMPWTAPVYYIFRAGKCYFFSNQMSRHIRHLELGADAAASIFKDSPSIDGLAGVQMQGRCTVCSPGREAVTAAAAYALKYGIFIKGDHPVDYFARVFKAALYAFVPESVYFMDNSTGFGHRTLVIL